MKFYPGGFALRSVSFPITGFRISNEFDATSTHLLQQYRRCRWKPLLHPIRDGL